MQWERRRGGVEGGGWRGGGGLPAATYASPMVSILNKPCGRDMVLKHLYVFVNPICGCTTYTLYVVVNPICG